MMFLGKDYSDSGEKGGHSGSGDEGNLFVYSTVDKTNKCKLVYWTVNLVTVIEANIITAMKAMKKVNNFIPYT
jgi:uncharacterized membrane protein